MQNCSNEHAALLRFLFTEDSLILRKIFILYYINWPNFITRLCLLLKLFSRMCFVFPKFVRGSKPRTPSQIFKGTHPLTQLTSSLFWNFCFHSPLFYSTPLLRYLRQLTHPHAENPPPAFIRHINFRQIRTDSFLNNWEWLFFIRLCWQKKIIYKKFCETENPCIEKNKSLAMMRKSITSIKSNLMKIPWVLRHCAVLVYS